MILNATVAKQFRSELEALLAKYGAEANFEIKVGKITYWETTMKAEIVATVAGEKKLEEKALDAIIKSYKLNQVNSAGDRLIEFHSGRGKYKFVYISARDSKRYKTTWEHVANTRIGWANPITAGKVTPLS